MRTLVFCLEEPSAREMLKGILPRLLPDDIAPIYLVFEGKQDLEKQLVKRLRGWRKPDTQFAVLRDQDAANCSDVKRKLVDLCQQAGRSDALVRVACRELESFYLGDLVAVEQGLGVSNISKRQLSRKFRNPDRLANPARELGRLTQHKYQKVAGSRAIGPHLNLTGNHSHSFRVLLRGLTDLAEGSQ